MITSYGCITHFFQRKLYSPPGCQRHFYNFTIGASSKVMMYGILSTYNQQRLLEDKTLMGQVLLHKTARIQSSKQTNKHQPVPQLLQHNLVSTTLPSQHTNLHSPHIVIACKPDQHQTPYQMSHTSQMLEIEKFQPVAKSVLNIIYLAVRVMITVFCTTQPVNQHATQSQSIDTHHCGLGTCFSLRSSSVQLVASKKKIVFQKKGGS